MADSRKWYRLPGSGVPYFGTPPEGATILAHGPKGGTVAAASPLLATEVERASARAAGENTDRDGEGDTDAGEGDGPPTLLSQPVNRIVEQLDGADLDTIEKLLIEERDGAARKGLIDQLERMRDNLTDTG